MTWLSLEGQKVGIKPCTWKAVLTKYLAEVDIVDHILSQEDEECQALVSLMHESKSRPETLRAEDQEETMSDYGSDAGDYDRLFMDVLSRQQQQASNSAAQDEDKPLVEHQDIDISME